MRFSKPFIIKNFHVVFLGNPHQYSLKLSIGKVSILFYTTRVMCKGEMTMEEIVLSLKHYWRFVDSEALELQGLSWDSEPKVA